MTINKPPGPPGGAAVLGQAVSHLMSRTPALAPLGGTPTQASQPIEVFTVRLDDIKDDKFLSAARPFGWRYLIVGQRPVAIADVTAGTGGGAAFSRLTHGEIAERLGEALDLAAHLYDTDPMALEARILEIPPLYLAAVWLHGARDIFIPFLEGNRRDPSVVREDPTFLMRVVRAASQRRSP
jgi:hypothetical protein